MCFLLCTYNSCSLCMLPKINTLVHGNHICPRTNVAFWGIIFSKPTKQMCSNLAYLPIQTGLLVLFCLYAAFVYSFPIWYLMQTVSHPDCTFLNFLFLNPVFLCIIVCGFIECSCINKIKFKILSFLGIKSLSCSP